MQILEYDNVNPFSVLELNLLSFRFALTPELAASIRRLDQRRFGIGAAKLFNIGTQHSSVMPQGAVSR